MFKNSTPTIEFLEAKADALKCIVLTTIETNKKADESLIIIGFIFSL